jgi:hypothetical protein
MIFTYMLQGNVYDMQSLQLLAIKPKTWRDLVNDEPFTRKDIITIQDPENLASRDLREFDYVKTDKKIMGASALQRGLDLRRRGWMVADENRGRFGQPPSRDKCGCCRRRRQGVEDACREGT